MLAIMSTELACWQPGMLRAVWSGVSVHARPGLVCARGALLKIQHREVFGAALCLAADVSAFRLTADRCCQGSSGQNAADVSAFRLTADKCCQGSRGQNAVESQPCWPWLSGHPAPIVSDLEAV